MCALVFLASFASGCSSDVTQLIVVVDTDLSVPMALDEVRVEVSGPSGEVRSELQPLADASDLPLTLGVVAEAGVAQDDRLGPVKVVAIGMFMGREQLRASASVMLLRGQTRMLRLMLAADCLTVSCADGESCTRGRCAPESTTTERWPGRPPSRDAGLQGDGSVDGGRCRPLDCDDGDVCTDDLCTAEGCSHLPNDELRATCTRCVTDADCPTDPMPEWSACDFGADPCSLAGTRSRSVRRFTCDVTASECVENTELQMEACTRPATDTNGMGCVIDAASGLCQDGTCCTGCLEGASCAAGTSDMSCGIAGRSCSRCTGVAPRCGPAGTCVQCANASDCDDGNTYTTDACSANVCVHTCTGCVGPGGTCRSGDFPANCGRDGANCSSCAGATPFCLSGTCVECQGSEDCGDGNACTNDSCVDGVCTHVANWRSCMRASGPGKCVGGSCCLGCQRGGACYPGITSGKCGEAGTTCQDCTGGTPTCDPTTHTCVP